MKLNKEQQEIINKVHDFVKLESMDFAEDDVFKNHILSVRNFSIFLAKEYKANIFIVTIAAYLHDIYYIKTHKHDIHEIGGSKFAKQYLKQFNISEKEIELIAKCILNHRGSKKRKRNTLEERIIACADAMDHIDRIQHMFYRVSKKMSYNNAIRWISNKLERGWKKIDLKKGQYLIRKKYTTAKIFFKS